jgi:hypothetical protein
VRAARRGGKYNRGGRTPWEPRPAPPRSLFRAAVAEYAIRRRLTHSKIFLFLLEARTAAPAGKVPFCDGNHSANVQSALSSGPSVECVHKGDRHEYLFPHSLGLAPMHGPSDRRIRSWPSRLPGLGCEPLARGKQTPLRRAGAPVARARRAAAAFCIDPPAGAAVFRNISLDRVGGYVILPSQRLSGNNLGLYWDILTIIMLDARI